MSRIKNVVLVGHCGADQYMLEGAVSKALSSDVNVSVANSTEQLQRVATADFLLLINRQLDGSFDSTSGIELIGNMASRSDSPKMMLISNYSDAQEQAISVGAQRGFGKSQLEDPLTIAVLRQAVHGSGQSAVNTFQE